MKKEKADEIITEYLPKIFGFCMKKAFSYEEAEELSSDIVEEVYLSILKRDDIYNIDGYIRRICQHVYSRYVALKKKQTGISIDGLEMSYEQEFLESDTKEEIDRLHREIAFLSKTRREIVYSFYYENKKISLISAETGIPEGTVKWHLNKARNELKDGMDMERKIGKLGLKPIKADNFGHGGDPTGGGPEEYMSDDLSLNIVYSVYYEPRTKEEIAEELGVTPVFLEEKINYLEENGFLVRQAGNKYTTYVCFDTDTYSLELEENKIKKKLEVAEVLAKYYAEEIRKAIADVEDVYIPGGNRQLLEAAAIVYGITDKCKLSLKTDISKYYIKTTAGGNYIANVFLPQTQSDPDYKPTIKSPSYWACGTMTRGSDKYPGVYSWSIDSRYSTREGAWMNNHNSDYEYLYEFMTGAISDTPANEGKFKRLRKRKFITEDNVVNIMVVKGKYKDFFDKIPSLDKKIKDKFAEYALETAMLLAKDYPPQMQDLIIFYNTVGFIGNEVALMVLDILYGNGTFRPLTENEKVTSNLIMFSDVLPENK